MKFRYLAKIITILTRAAALSALTLLLLATAFSAQADTKRTFRVLVLYWDNKDFPGNIKFDESFQATLRSSSSGNIEYYPEYMETSRFPGQDQAFFRDYLRQKYAGRLMDVVVSNADPPLNFLIKYRADLFPNAPIIFVSNQPPGSDVLAAGPGMTGIVHQSTHAPTLDLALILQPDTQHVFVISGSREHDKRFETAARDELSRFANRVEINYLTDLPLNELSSRLASLPPKSIAFYIWQQATDDQGRLLETYEVLSQIAPRSSAPIYGMGSGNLGLGIIGGYLQGPENNGAKVASMALRIMGGARAQDIRLENAPTLAMFDWRQLRRWGINEKDLPPGSVIRFREVSFWELYKWYIIGLIAAVIIEAMLITALLFQRVRRRQAELESQRLARQAEAKHKELDEVVSNVPGLVWEARLQPENGASKTTFISDYIEQMLGYTAEEWMAKPPGFGATLIPDEEEREQVKQDSERVLQTGKDGFTQFRWRAKDGRMLWVESHLNPVFDEDHKVIGLRGVTLDVSERKSAEERFGKAFRANPQPMSITTIEDGRYVDVNDSFLSMSGYLREEVIGQSSLELGVWGSPKERREFITELLENGSIVNRETRFYTKTGKTRILLSSAEPLSLGGERCVLMASSDVTERVHIQEALRESEQRFRNMADTAPVMIWVTDTDKMCTYFNQQGLDFTGFTMEQAMGYGWTAAVHPDDSERCVETYNSAFDARQPFRMEFRLRQAEGTFRWVFASGEPRFSQTGQFLGYIGTCLDIADLKESEEALQVAHEELSRLKNQLQQENIYLKEEISLSQDFGDIVGRSDALNYVLFKIEQVAPTDSTVLITGETGTGKELVARAIHKASSRRDRPLVRVNCAALAATLIESELFGHEKGAFTGAMTRKIGRFELADGATIFLDEIGELPLELQAKLLRVIQEGEFERLGSSKTITVDVRIIAATNRNLELDVKNGSFREDLWYRLNVFPITVPPLRDRAEDISLLVEHFAALFSKKLGKVITSVSPASLKTLCDYSWPGNVRELANVMERAIITTKGSVLRIGDDFGKLAADQMEQSGQTLEELERDYILRILANTAWRIDGPHGAARILGLNASTLRTRMLKLGIQKPGPSNGKSSV